MMGILLDFIGRSSRDILVARNWKGDSKEVCQRNKCRNWKMTPSISYRVSPRNLYKIASCIHQDGERSFIDISSNLCFILTHTFWISFSLTLLSFN